VRMMVRGALQVEALERAVRELVRRHEALRTVFEEREGEAVQVVQGWEEWKLELADLSLLETEEARGAEARRLAEEDGERGFDLSRGPLLRVKLVKMGEREHVLLLNMHHIISDGWSVGVLQRELGRLYEEHAGGRKAGLEELEVQYGDYAAWQREWMKGEVLAGEVKYWREQLGGAPGLLELPTEKGRPAVQSYRGGHVEVELKEELVVKLRKMCRQERVTMNMALLAAYGVMLGRYARQEEVVVGTPVAGRTRVEMEGLI